MGSFSSLKRRASRGTRARLRALYISKLDLSGFNVACNVFGLEVPVEDHTPVDGRIGSSPIPGKRKKNCTVISEKTAGSKKGRVLVISLGYAEILVGTSQASPSLSLPFAFRICFDLLTGIVENALLFHVGIKLMT